jgi:hypothetical protein
MRLHLHAYKKEEKNEPDLAQRVEGPSLLGRVAPDARGHLAHHAGLTYALKRETQ